MMMVPYMFNEALMDDLFSNDWEHDFDRAMKAAAPRGMFGKRAANVMKTDVRENKDSYDVFVDLPGFKKEDVKLDLDNGYLTISAQRNEELDDTRAAISARSVLPAAAHAASMSARNWSPRTSALSLRTAS